MSLSKVLAKLGLREIKNNWKQLFAITTIGAIAVTLFVGLMANAENFSSRVEKTFDNGNMADIWVTTKSHDKKDEAKIKEIVGDYGEVESRFEITGQAGSHSIYAVIENSEPTISKPYDLTKGEKDTDTYFVRVDEAISNKNSPNGYKIGEALDVTIDMSSFGKAASWLSDALHLEDYYEDDNNPFKMTSMCLNLEVTGYMKYPENIAKASYSSSTVIISDLAFHQAFDNLLIKNMKENLTPEEKEEESALIHEVLSEANLFLERECDKTKRALAPNQYLITIKDESKTNSIKTSIEEYYDAKRSGNLVSINDRSNMPFVVTVHNDVEQARNFTYLFPFVFFFVAILVILTTTSQIILKERAQIGTMKAIGLSGAEIMSLYIMITVIVVGLGTLIGEILGPIIVPLIMNNKYGLIYTLPAIKYVFPVVPGILTALAFLSLAGLTTFFVARKEISLKPTESMRPKKVSFKSLSMKVEPKHGIRFLSFKMAMRNMRINVVKSAMVVAGILGCTALLVCGYGIEDTINYGLSHDTSLGNAQDITLTFSSPKTKEEIENDILSIDGIKTFEMFSRATSKISNPQNDKMSDSFVYVLGESADQSHFKFVPDLPLDKVSISQKIHDETGLNPGDTLDFVYSNVTYTAEVYSVYDAFFYNGVIVTGDSPILGDWSNTYSGCSIDIEEGKDATAIKENLILNLSYILTAQTRQDWINSINDVMGGIMIMTNAVKVFAILLALVVLYNLALMNFKDRSRDIATMKVLGFTKGEIASSLLYEMMTLTIVGVIIGLFLGIPFLYGVLMLNKVDVIYYIVTVNALSFVIAFFLTAVVSFIINGFYSFRSDKVKMVESLKSVE